MAILSGGTVSNMKMIIRYPRLSNHQWEHAQAGPTGH